MPTGHDHELDRALADPIGLIADLVADVEKDLDTETIWAVVAAIAGGRAKSRRLADALATLVLALPRRPVRPPDQRLGHG
ncbi:hypothetical protein [Streptomyces sp. ME19-01-6]|uniref:hypothetical protein n=1 Tax=Streptomyces sp. ME19-01-6 TaxID=3028686 RepID=UPI0029ACFB1B|nr:hypothetical protein [Streptomyces sp. ME19-01-6]MDX3229151.1 hypothetical protein [Streptomyces sp. ME19-01-6]